MDESPTHPLHTFLVEHPKVRFIRMQWADLSGVLRARIAPKTYCMQLIASSKPICVDITTCVLFPVSALQLAGTPARTGCAELQPDWSSLRLCLFAPTHASVMCNINIPVMEVPYCLCCRSMLKDSLSKAEKSFDMAFLVGFEIEFIILNEALESDSLRDPLTSWSSTTSGLRGTILSALEETVAILEDSDVLVQTFHTEGPLQLEIATGPLPPLEAIDTLIYTHEAIKTIFARHGCRVTMAPNAASAVKSGAHIHLSLSKPEQEESFLAGMLQHLAGISAFGLANYDSFVRVKDLMCAAGTWVSWGLQHRDVPIRKIKAGYWEIRCVDATANIYLVVSLLIAAGLEGVAKSIPLTMEGLSDYPVNLGALKLEEAGVRQKLPKSMKEAYEMLREDTTVDRFISDELKDAYLGIKGQDLEAMSRMSEGERRRLFVKTF